MVFSSLIFLYVFLPLCLLAVWLGRDTKVQNAILLIASLFFYAWGEPIYVILMVLTAFIIWLCGRLLGRTSSKTHKKVFLVLAIVMALSSLVYFKYSGFWVEILNLLPFVNF